MNDIDTRRREASDRLRQAWNDGRIDAAEHERRVTALRNAGSPAEIDAIERGELPAAHGSVVSPIPPVEERSVDPTPRSDRTTGIIKVDKKVAGTISALVPFLCLLAFFGFEQSWLVFLAIPVVGILLYGPDGNDKD